MRKLNCFITFIEKDHQAAVGDFHLKNPEDKKKYLEYVAKKSTR